jgi:hypothetical protein
MKLKKTYTFLVCNTHMEYLVVSTAFCLLCFFICVFFLSSVHVVGYNFFQCKENQLENDYEQNLFFFLFYNFYIYSPVNKILTKEIYNNLYVNNNKSYMN